MGAKNEALPVEELGLLRWLRRYVWLRWLSVGALLLGVMAARFVLGLRLPLFPVLGVAAAVALYSVLFESWRRRREQRCAVPGATVRWRQRFGLAQIVVDLVALTVLLHFVGGVETPFFLFYFFYVGLGSIMLSRQDAYKVILLAIALFVLLVGAEFLNWLPHVHLDGFVSPGLYQEEVYVATVLLSFVVTLVVSMVGVTAVVAELRQQWGEQALVKERELKETSKKLADLDRMRVFFLGLASHDLKTPLAVVANYLQAILDGFVGEVNEKQRRWMERANVRVLELIRLIDDFVDVSQLDADRVTGEMQRMRLIDTVERSVGDVQHRVDEKGIALRVEVPQELPELHAAPRRLQQVITNLLDNAIKCSPRQGEVLLAVCHLGDGMRVDVVDSGPGIPTRHMPHVFEDYLQVQRKEFVPGAGLGLSTARKIVEVHGGKIWVESPCYQDGRGTRFSFTLPCKELVSEIAGSD